MQLAMPTPPAGSQRKESLDLSLRLGMGNSLLAKLTKVDMLQHRSESNGEFAHLSPMQALA